MCIVLLLNRALCHRKLEKWDSVQADCQRVLAMDDSVKAHYLLGLALQHQLPPQFGAAEYAHQ